MTEADLLRENAELRTALARFESGNPELRDLSFREQARSALITGSLLENAELRANNARLREASKLLMNRLGLLDPSATVAFLELRKILSETPTASLEAIRAEERERSAKAVEELMTEERSQSTASVHNRNMHLRKAAQVIRARGDGGEPKAEADFDPHASKHPYESTACMHGKHSRCRLECKFCHSSCQCSCHAKRGNGGEKS